MLEDLEKRLHKSMEQIVKREGYPNVQSFQKVYNKAEALIMEYNEELRAWKNQTEQKKENPLEQPKKASVLEKLHRYQQEGRQQPKRSVKKNLWIETVRKVETIMKKKIFEKWAALISDKGIILSPVLPCRRKNRDLSVYGDKDIYAI